MFVQLLLTTMHRASRLCLASFTAHNPSTVLSTSESVREYKGNANPLKAIIQKNNIVKEQACRKNDKKNLLLNPVK